jgi:hypothetical protein
MIALLVLEDSVLYVNFDTVDAVYRNIRENGRVLFIVSGNTVREIPYAFVSNDDEDPLPLGCLTRVDFIDEFSDAAKSYFKEFVLEDDCGVWLYARKNAVASVEHKDYKLHVTLTMGRVITTAADDGEPSMYDEALEEYLLSGILSLDHGY